MTPEQQTRIAQATVDAVRQASQALRLVSRAEILAAVRAHGPANEEESAHEEELAQTAPGELEPLLDATLAGAPGLAALQSLTGETLYHAPELLSHTYARILDRKGSPLALMAEEIRANSRDYPRPVPVELFEEPPFALAPEDIAQTLRAMAESADYQDITFTTASTGAVYLFSTRHLERGYADFLAQRAETLVLNP